MSDQLASSEDLRLTADDLKHAVLTKHGIKAVVAQDRLDRLLNLADALDRLPTPAAVDEDLIREAREYIEADNHSPDGYAEDLVRRLLICLPAASQATPEMPGYVAQRIRWARDRKIARAVTAQEEATVWLADRVAELERENNALHTSRGTWIQAALEASGKIEALQSSAAQETKRFDALWHALPFDQRHRFGGDPAEARQAIDGIISRPLGSE